MLSLRGWLLCRLAGLEFTEHIVDSTEPGVQAELLLLSPSILVPRLEHDGLVVWDTLAIAEYLHELRPDAGLLPSSPADRARCRSVCGEMHSGFANLRAALPMNIKARHRNFKVWAGAQADIDRILTIWSECLLASGGPYLFGSAPTMADIPRGLNGGGSAVVSFAGVGREDQQLRHKGISYSTTAYGILKLDEDVFQVRKFGNFKAGQLYSPI